MRFLQKATRQQILDAAALNHTAYFGQAVETGGEDAFPSETYDWSPHSWNGKEAVVPYPRFNPSTISQDVAHFMAECRRRGVKVASARTHGETAPAELTASLLAQGFGPAGPDPILSLDLTRSVSSNADPDGLLIKVIEDEEAWERIAPKNLPNRRLRHRESSTDPSVRRSWHFAAWRGDQPIGHVQLLLTRGPLGVAGLYNLGVAGSGREIGASAALLRAACRHARDLGCGYAVLTEIGDPDPALGFEAVGQGRSWWIQEPEIDTPPSPEAVAFVEAVGRGETGLLDRLEPSSLPDDLDQPLMCSLTPLEVAALTHQPESAEWLINHGATPELVSLWDLGWKERILDLLSRQPELVNRRFSQEKKTPLHQAVWRDDAEFARFLLDHGADPTLEDESFHSTPLGWAQHLGRPELIRLLEDYAAPDRQSDS